MRRALAGGKLWQRGERPGRQACSGGVAERDEQAARDVLESAVGEALRPAVQAVAMDMWKPFVKAVGVVLPEGDIVFDKFHMVRLLPDAVDKVDKEEHRQLLKEGDATLSGSKYWWLKSPGNLTANQWRSFKCLLAINLSPGLDIDADLRGVLAVCGANSSPAAFQAVAWPLQKKQA